MSRAIHPTAIVDPGAELGEDVVIGPYAIIGPRVTRRRRCAPRRPRVILERNVRLADRVQVGAGSILGGDPQDFKYRG